MLKRVLVLVLALVLITPGLVFAGSGGGGTHTTTQTTSTSTSTSNSTSTSTSTSSHTETYSQNLGQVYSSSTISGWVTNTAHQSWNMSYTAVVQSYVGSGAQFAEIIAANFGSPQNYLYYQCANGWSGTLQGQGALGFDPVNTYHSIISGRGSVYADQLTLQSSQNVVLDLGSKSSTSVSTSQQQSTQMSTQVSTQVTSTDQEIKIGDFVIGTNTVVNTNTNTNTNTNVNTNTNYDYDTVVNKYAGYGTVNVYSAYGSVWVSPIVLDLSGSGKLDASGGDWMPHRGLKGSKVALFDFNANNQAMLMEWVGPNAGLLVEPKADGTIDGSCLFGTTGGFENGYEKLSVRDRNNDGRLSAAELDGLYVWVDRNSNARLDKGELQSLGAMKVTELGLQHKGFRSTFVMAGKTQTMWDWWPSAMNVRKVKTVVKK